MLQGWALDWIRTIGVARGGRKGPCPPKFLENIVILCFERRFSKQNSVIRLKSNTLTPPNFLARPKFLGWLRYWSGLCWILLNLDCIRTGNYFINLSTSPNRWFADVNMTSYFGVTNSVYPVSINDHHTPLLNTTAEFGGTQSSCRPGHHQTSARHWYRDVTNTGRQVKMATFWTINERPTRKVTVRHWVQSHLSCCKAIMFI